MNESSSAIALPTSPVDCLNYVNGKFVAGHGRVVPVDSPLYGTTIGSVTCSTARDVDSAVVSAEKAWPAFRDRPLRERIELLLRFRSHLAREVSEVARCVSLESGKTEPEARAGILRGIEVIDFAASLANSDLGGALEVSRGVRCEYLRRPLGVVAGITPFNFPAMVPLWMLPIALTVGNAFILKPSEKVPLTAQHLARLLHKAGYPSGIFSVVHGDRDTAAHLVAHPQVQAIGFVGSTAAAKTVYATAASHGKRALCLGGAKNHLIVTPDADPQLTVKAVVDSFTGCAGQRCMAGSVLVAVGDCQRLIDQIVQTAGRLRPGLEIGALIDQAAVERLSSAIAQAQSDGCVVALDGRDRSPRGAMATGHWLAPTVLDHVPPGSECARQELFGPVLSIVRVASLQEGLALDASNPYGNATSVFTGSGAVARAVMEHCTSGMIGINIGVPVPREPFSFGGTKASKFGHGDMTGASAVEFWTDRQKVTSKWALQQDSTWMS